jgi:hypothetical protein
MPRKPIVRKSNKNHRFNCMIVSWDSLDKTGLNYSIYAGING